jgi:hypothetical protein
VSGAGTKRLTCSGTGSGKSTGKTTWLRTVFPDVPWFDLLDPARAAASVAVAWPTDLSNVRVHRR